MKTETHSGRVAPMRGLDMRVFPKGALAEQEFKGGTGRMTERIKWIETFYGK